MGIHSRARPTIASLLVNLNNVEDEFIIITTETENPNCFLEKSREVQIHFLITREVFFYRKITTSN